MRKRLLFILIIVIAFNMVGCKKAEEDDNEFIITDEEREVLKKSYKDLDEKERITLSIIEIKINKPESMATEEDKQNFERLQQEKEEYGERLAEINKSNNDEPLEVDRKSELETTVKNIIKNGDYNKVAIEDITINDDMGRDEEGYYIALIRLKFGPKNRINTANEMMRMYSDDIVATLANKGIEDISEAVVFWEDEYNNRSLKYAYEFKDGKFYVMDIMGE
ncbi:hypothetical protein [Anaerosalibacter bizertensis]|uniref:hypothetical protein n=1 Tax=Anaerosalibacter bizertensis TaxID=932217 RepID=UPI003512F44B